jgi:hypothetical protein
MGIYKVNRCSSCWHGLSDRCNHPAFNRARLFKNKHAIPEWCPLTAAKVVGVSGDCTHSHRTCGFNDSGLCEIDRTECANKRGV